MADAPVERPYVSPLLRPLTVEEDALLSIVWSPVVRGTYTWPTWDYVDLTFRKETGLEARTVIAGLPWVPLGPQQIGVYRPVWFSDSVPAGSAPYDGRMTVGLTVAGLCGLSPAGGAADGYQVDQLSFAYVIAIRTLAANLLTATPDPAGVVDTSLSFDLLLAGAPNFTSQPDHARGLLHDVVMHEPATTIRADAPDNWRVVPTYPLDQLGRVDNPREYVEIITAMNLRQAATAVLERRPTDLVDALARLDMAFRAVTRRRLWQDFPTDQFSRLVQEPTSGPDYRDALVAIASVVESMSVPRVPGLDANARSLGKLAAFLGAYLDPERTLESEEAVNRLRDVAGVRQGIAHTNDNAARRANEAARRLGISPVVTDIPATYDVIARAVIASARSIGDLLIEADSTGRDLPDVE